MESKNDSLANPYSNEKGLLSTRQSPEMSLLSSTQPPTSLLLSPSSPGSSSVTPDTTKELIENGDDEEDETILVDDHDSIGRVDDENNKLEERSVPKTLPCSSGSITKNGITVELVGQHLWKKFHKLGTEMIITKAGR